MRDCFNDINRYSNRNLDLPTIGDGGNWGTQQFTATVRDTTNTVVTWQVNAVAGGNATVGTVSSSGLYTAPAVVPNPARVTIEKMFSRANTALRFHAVAGASTSRDVYLRG